jgi:hypothetical protein
LDGENVVPGGLVINAGQEVDLERWIKNGNLSEGNRFKFIERTSAIENGPRGIKLEDGLVRIEYQFEKAIPVNTWNNQPIYRVTDIFPNGIGTSSEYKGVTDKFSVTASGSTTQFNVGGILRGYDTTAGQATLNAATTSVNSYCAQNNIQNKVEVHDSMATMDACVNDVGITVPGSKSTQSFTTATTGIMESDKYSMVIKLLGGTADNKLVTKPVTVKAKPKCITCGRQNKATAKFCTECGAALEIFA